MTEPHSSVILYWRWPSCLIWSYYVTLKYKIYATKIGQIDRIRSTDIFSYIDIYIYTRKRGKWKHYHVNSRSSLSTINYTTDEALYIYQCWPHDFVTSHQPEMKDIPQQHNLYYIYMRCGHHVLFPEEYIIVYDSYVCVLQTTQSRKLWITLDLWYEPWIVDFHNSSFTFIANMSVNIVDYVSYIKWPMRRICLQGITSHY